MSSSPVRPFVCSASVIFTIIAQDYPKIHFFPPKGNLQIIIKKKKKKRNEMIPKW